MSQIQVDKIYDKAGTGAPQLTLGAEVPVGYGITGAGGINVSGALTCGNITGADATFSGTLTYDDVTNVDAVGFATFQKGVNITGVCTATSYQGDGSALTGIAATDNINTNAIQVSGITTFQSLMEPFDFWMFGG